MARTVDRMRGWLNLRPSGKALVIVVVLFGLADWGSEMAGNSFFPGAPLDETAHFLTTLLVFWALAGKRAERYLWPALVASVAIDLDHVPQYLGYRGLTAGTPRPYSHSLLTILVVLVLAEIWRRRRDMFVGVAIGLAVHFWRDTAEPHSGVALLWPLSKHSFSTPHGLYLALMGGVIVVAWVRSASRWRDMRSPRRRGGAPALATTVSPGPRYRQPPLPGSVPGRVLDENSR